MVFVVLDFTEIVGMTDGETVMSIKLKKSSVKGIFTSSGSGGRIIKPSVTRKSTSGSVVDVSVSPDKFFNGVVKVKVTFLVLVEAPMDSAPVN